MEFSHVRNIIVLKKACLFFFPQPRTNAKPFSVWRPCENRGRAGFGVRCLAQTEPLLGAAFYRDDAFLGVSFKALCVAVRLIDPKGKRGFCYASEMVQKCKQKNK